MVETNYCVTLDRVPEELYPEIAANDSQREEWVRLFAIEEIQGDMFSPAYSEPLTVEFLKANPFLVLDTQFFDGEFKNRFLESLDNMEASSIGVVLNSENFQAIQLLSNRYTNDLECIYIDPPYNTDASPIIYKNGYRTSSWVTMMDDRLNACKRLLKEDGVLAVAIDDAQQRELSFILTSAFNRNDLGTFCVRSNPSGRPTQTGYSVSHEYVLFAGKSKKSVVGRLPPTAKQLARFSEKDDRGRFEWRNLRREGSNSDRSARRHLYYPIFIGIEGIRIPEMIWDELKERWIAKEKPSSNEQIVYPDNEQGHQKTWRWSPKKVSNDLSELAIRRDRSGKDYVYYKRRPHEAGIVSMSSWFDAKYSATEHGTALLKDLFGVNPFSYPKSLFAVCDSIFISGGSNGNSTILDFFAGSGTTAHATIHLNREGGQRKYILVEMGDYFGTVLVPRIKKVVYSKDWQEGKPLSREGISHMFKYIRLESYEDALSNIELQRTGPQQMLLDKVAGFRESYMLKYMFDVESRGSQTLLNIENFDDPWNYKLLVGTGSVGETKPVNVDLVETFNWLLGLKVIRMERIDNFQVVEGENRNEEKVLIIWRKIRELSETDPANIIVARDKANRDLEAFFKDRQYNTLDSKFDLIYVNGDNNLMNVPLNPDRGGMEPRYKVRLIEEEFKRLMFDVTDI